MCYHKLLTKSSKNEHFHAFISLKLHVILHTRKQINKTKTQNEIHK